MKTNLITYVLIAVAFINIRAQQINNDSLLSLKDDTGKVKLLLEQARTLSFGNKLSREYALQSEIISEKLNYQVGIRNAASFLGNYAFLHGDYDNALKYYTSAMNISDKMNLKKETASMMMGIGLTYYAKSDIEQSLNWHLRSLKLRETISDTPGIGTSYIHLANIYQFRNNYDKAEEYNQSALTIKKQTGDKEGAIYCLGNLGTIYGARKKYDQALTYFEEALSLARTTGNKRLEANCLGNMGSVYQNMDDNKKALEYMSASLKLDEEADDKEGIATSLINIAGLHSKTGDTENAIKTYEKSLQLSREMGALDHMKIIYKNLSEIYNKKNDHLTAYKYLLSYSEIKDSILNIENQESVNRLQELYQSEKKDKEIILKDHEIEKQGLQNSRQKLFIVFVALMLILVVAFSFVLYNRFKLTKKQKITIEEKQKEIVDSINYAQRIQKALLASDDLLRSNLNEYFVFFRPKDIVSGDFYWAAAVSNRNETPASKGHNNLFYLAVCDSTGHGVPGAFMSLLNISFLNEAINEKKIEKPGEVFNHVRKRLIESISSDGARDGMDALLFCMDKQNNTITYSAANSAPVMIRNETLIELEKDKMPVGKDEKNTPFKTLELKVQKNDTLYLYTDGYADQFGGPKGKKFKYKQLEEILLSVNHFEMEKQKEIIAEKFEEWKGELEQIDDVLLIGIKF